jgi:hypothetical protein
MFPGVRSLRDRRLAGHFSKARSGAPPIVLIDVKVAHPPDKNPPLTFFIPPLHNPVRFGITNRVEDK